MGWRRGGGINWNDTVIFFPLNQGPLICRVNKQSQIDIVHWIVGPSLKFNFLEFLRARVMQYHIFIIIGL